MLGSMVNASVLEANVTLEQIASAFNLNITTSNETNVTGAVTPEKLFSLYEAYRAREIEQLMLYKSVAYVLGTLIILSNLTVVISSGLILRKGQQPKSTYLLLGNVSLADTIIGMSLIFGTTVDSIVASDVMCLFQIGMIVCPTMVSIFSVGFIAIDRYIYIIHGLYYQRWINTTRVRIGILIIWLVGLILGFMPATGWVNQELKGTRCSYISVFPGGLILINSILSVIPIAVVAVLYVKILIRALRNFKTINNAKKQINVKSSDRLRIYRGNLNGNKVGNINYSNKFPDKNGLRINRSSSMSDVHRIKKAEANRMLPYNVKAKSIDELNSSDDRRVTAGDNVESKQNNFDSKLSILTIHSDYNDGSRNNVSASTLKQSPNKVKQMYNRVTKKLNGDYKSKEPRKLRAVAIVMLTSGSFIITWLPFFIVVCFYVFCTNKIGNLECISLNALLRGPLATLAFLNSILNPLIYAWWHRGFKSALKSYLIQHCCKKKCLK
ncbi:5-hydroxytryptamine receptor 1A isoform X1 [Plutella xylostella]|uniref:5-hydroxytryptamine receptor 1A isoform X1 n=1 Tax=Plutella xylostella TaxID=51655 RepID=UPI002032CB9E|nr:5-hydroxytryptamine receptor 1A isoform X1 [Plutella xylostella]